MDIKEAVRAALKEMIIPELNTIKAEHVEMKVALENVHKRLDDMNAHLVDQSRRIDQTNQRIDSLQIEIDYRFEETHKRMDRLYEVIVRREDTPVLSKGSLPWKGMSRN